MANEVPDPNGPANDPSIGKAKADFHAAAAYQADTTISGRTKKITHTEVDLVHDGRRRVSLSGALTVGLALTVSIGLIAFFFGQQQRSAPDSALIKQTVAESVKEALAGTTGSPSTTELEAAVSKAVADQMAVTPTPVPKADFDAVTRAQDEQRREQLQHVKSLEAKVDGLQGQLGTLLARVPEPQRPSEPPPPRPKAVFVVLPGLSSADSKIAPSAFDMREGIKRHLDYYPGVVQNPTNLSPPDTLRWVLRIPELNAHDNDVVLQTSTTVDMNRAIEVVFIAEGDNPQQTIDIVRQRLKQYECVLVIGHEQSTPAQRLYQLCYAIENIPVILLGPTNPQLTREDAGRGTDRQLLLRMLPIDDYQVVAIRQAILREEADYPQNRKSAISTEDILVVSDGTNEVYSNYIAEKISQDEMLSGRFRGSIRVNLQNTLIPYQDTLSRWGPRWIVFVGMGPTAQVFVSSLEREWNIADLIVNQNTKDGKLASDLVSQNASLVTNWLRGTSWIFSDGCANIEFAKYLKDRKACKWGSMTIISSMGPAPDADPVLGKRFDYKELGSAATVVAQYLLLKAGSPPTAAGVVREMAVLRASREKLVLQSDAQKDRYRMGVGDWKQRILGQAVTAVQFDARGDNTLWAWHAYRRKNDGQFEQVTTTKDVPAEKAGSNGK